MKLPGLDCSVEGAEQLINLAMEHRKEFDALVFSGRTGGFLAAVFQICRADARNTPALVLPSKWHAAGVLGRFPDNLSQDDVSDLAPEFRKMIGDLTKSLGTHPRFLLVDDTVTVVEGSTYQFIRELLMKLGGELVGYLSGVEGFDNGFDGFHADANWSRWNYYYNCPEDRSGQDLMELRAMKEGGTIDPNLTVILEMLEEYG